MNELKGKYVNIVLSVEEARGFDSIHSPLYITANFNGRVMESDRMEPHPNIVFNTEMVWETEKKLLRRARGAYSRVRLECHTEKNKFVGFCLLCLRSAKILPSSMTDFTIECSWNRLLNVPTEFKKGNPELSVSLTIRDYITNKVIPSALPGVDGLLSNAVIGNDSTYIPIRYTPNGYIQVGNDSDILEKYTLKITAKVAANLDLLLPEDLVFSQTVKKYYLCFQIFGMNVKTRHVARNLHESISVNETVVINILSTFRNLGAYFQKYSKIPVIFYNDDVKLGWADVSMDKMGWNSESAKLEIEEKSYFESDCYTRSPGVVRCPTLTTRCTIALTSREEGQGDKEESFMSPRVKYSSCDEGELLQGAKLFNSPEEKKSTLLETIARAEGNVDANTIELIKPPVPVVTTPIFGSYKKYCVDIVIDSIYWRRAVKNASYTFSFAHPKTQTKLNIRLEIDRQISKRILLENAVCKLTFVCASQRLEHLLSSYPARLQLLDGKGQPVAQEIRLDYGRVKEGAWPVVLKTLKGEDLAEISVCTVMEVAEVGREGRSNYDLLPHILDDTIVFEDINDLERWKESERVKFAEEIERQKKIELSVLQTEWHSRKNELELDLSNNISRCKRLSEKLKKTQQTLNLERVVETKRENDEHNIHLQIHKNTVKYSLLGSHELIAKISLLERDQAILKDLLSEQSLEMEEIKSSLLTNDQTKNLLRDLKMLEEKLLEAQKDKSYFKNEWETAVKEVHKLKREYQQSMQDNLKMERSQLQTFASGSVDGDD